MNMIVEHIICKMTGNEFINFMIEEYYNVDVCILFAI